MLREVIRTKGAGPAEYRRWFGVGVSWVPASSGMTLRGGEIVQ
jgi:hypothetical protein